MSVASIVLMSAVTGVISFGYITFGVYLFRRRDGIGVSALSVFCGVWGGKFILGSVAFYILSSNGITSAAGLRPSSLPDTTVLLVLGVVEPVLSALLTVTGIFAWLWFVLLYTRRVGSREKIAVGVIGGGTFLTLLLNGVVGAASSFGFIVIDPVLQTGITEFATVVEILGTGIAVGVGLSLLYSTVTTHHRFTESAMVGLTLPIVFPWLVGYLYTFSLVTSFQSINVLRGVTLAVGLVGLWLTVTEFGLFEQLPASQSVGRKTAFNSSDTAIVVVNNDGNVSDLNQAACELCEVTSTECIGKSFESLVPESVSVSEIRTAEPTTFEMPGSDTIVEATTTEATNETGQTIGETVVLTDITAERRRQQRIQVLNRVLRHNLRNDLNAVKGYIGVMADSDSEEQSEKFQSMAEELVDDLVTIGSKAQSTEQVLQADPVVNEATTVSSLVDDAVNTVESNHEHKEFQIDVSVPDEPAVRINPSVMDSIIQEVIENSIRHVTTPTVTVRYDESSGTLMISDDGPGIPDHEISVLQNAEETDLEHGSGLGLWLIKWGTDTFGGSITFDTENGTEVQIQFPETLIE